MTKKKLVTFITLAFVLITLISSVTIFYAHMPSINFTHTYQSVNRNMRNSLLSYLERNPDAEDFQKNLDQLFAGLSENTDVHFPMMFAWVDADTGEIVGQSSSYIWFRENNESNEWKYIHIEPYLTSEIKKQIVEYRDKTKQKMFYIYRMSFNVSSGEYIPVEMDIGFYGLYEKETIKLTDYEPELEINEKSEFSLFNYVFYDLDEESFDHKYYDKIRANVAEFAEEVKDGKYQNGGGGYAGSDRAYYCGGRYEVGEKLYLTCIFADHSEYYDTFRYTSFDESLIIILVLFTFVYGAVVIAASKLHDKNERLNKTLRSFTSAAAHELKTPLAVIQNQCECIIENVAPEKNEDYIKSVYDEAVRMNGIVSSFLQYNRLVNADKLQKEKCSLSEIVLTETEKYKAFADMRGVTINAEIPVDEITVNCNRDLISMAVDNYLSNAIKYATGDKKVTVKLEKDRFSVYNTSEGISRETADSMWDILSRDNKARTKDGSSTGMGLPICAEIFKAHGYEYGYKNVKDGAEFYFAAK